MFMPNQAISFKHTQHPPPSNFYSPHPPLNLFPAHTYRHKFSIMSDKYIYYKCWHRIVDSKLMCLLVQLSDCSTWTWNYYILSSF